MAKTKFTIDPTALGCDFCGLKENHPNLYTPRMKPSGNVTGGDILVLGEAPGKMEDREGEIFIGASGKLLRGSLSKSHLQRLVFQNSCRCRPPENRTPTPQEVHACSIYLEQDTERLPLKAILGCGNVPLHKFFPEAQILKIHGTRFPVRLGNRVIWYLPVFHPAYVLRQDQEGGMGKVKPIFDNDIKRFFRELDRWPDPEIMELSPAAVIVPRTYEEAKGLIARMADPVAMDLETADDKGPCLYPYRVGAHILTAAFSDGQTTVSFAIDHAEWQNPWGMKLLLETVRDRRWVAHNVSFEQSWFRFNAPGESFTNCEDTMALARLYHQRETLLSLEVLSRIHLGTNVKQVVQVDSRKIKTYSLEQVLQYNGLDAMATAPLFRKLDGQVDKVGYQRFMKTIDSVVGMELKGLPVSIETAKELREVWNDIAVEQADQAGQLAAVEAFVRDTGTEFNIASPKQISAILGTYNNVELPLTTKGNVSTAKAALLKIANEVTLAGRVLGYREATKLVSTYIDHVLQVPEIYPDLMLHPGYTVLLTATARLSSTNPNIQNFPRRRNAEVRNMIQAPDGYVLLAFDYAQLEARVLAMASKDKILCESIINGRDIHADWRDNLLHLYPTYIDQVMQMYQFDDSVDEKTLLKAIRDRVKNQFVFASFYGSSAKSCSEGMGLPLGIMEELAIQFWEEFLQVRKWLKERRTEYEQTGGMRTLTGRVRYQILYKYNEPVNTPIQGTAADIVAEAMNEMTELSRRERDPYLHPRIQVHDDLTFLVPDNDRLEYYVETISKILVKVRFPWQIVPLAVEAKIGTKWAELEDFAVFTGDMV